VKQDVADSAVKMAAAWIGVIGSVIVSVIALVSALLSQRANKRSQRELETLKAELDERKAEKNARRDYVYEARKRLYQECEPIMFYLYESSITGIKRIRSLARTAREGDLGPERPGWLSSEGYYTLSTIYLLMAPLTAFKLIQRRLTLVDLTVDPHIKAQYLLAKQLYLSFTSDFKLARQRPALEYKPNAQGWKERRVDLPAIYWRQGLPVGRLDNAVSSLITSEGSGAFRCMSFGEFESMYHGSSAEVRKNFQPVIDIFLNFHPGARPVLWRILITQLYLYRAVIRVSESSYQEGLNRSSLLEQIPEKDREAFDWRQSDAEAGDGEVLVNPFVAAECYLAENLEW
jgi:hypothetical protein